MWPICLCQFHSPIRCFNLSVTVFWNSLSRNYNWFISRSSFQCFIVWKCVPLNVESIAQAGFLSLPLWHLICTRGSCVWGSSQSLTHLKCFTLYHFRVLSISCFFLFVCLFIFFVCFFSGSRWLLSIFSAGYTAGWPSTFSSTSKRTFPRMEDAVGSDAAFYFSFPSGGLSFSRSWSQDTLGTRWVSCFSPRSRHLSPFTQSQEQGWSLAVSTKPTNLGTTCRLCHRKGSLSGLLNFPHLSTNTQ